MSPKPFDQNSAPDEQRAPMFMFVASFMAAGLMAAAVVAFGGVA